MDSMKHKWTPQELAEKKKEHDGKLLFLAEIEKNNAIAREKEKMAKKMAQWNINLSELSHLDTAEPRSECHWNRRSVDVANLSIKGLPASQVQLLVYGFTVKYRYSELRKRKINKPYHSFFGICINPKENLLHLVYDHIAGKSLHEILFVREKTLDKDKILQLAQDVAFGLQLLHRMDPPVVHAQLNPWNIVVKLDRARITNFVNHAVFNSSSLFPPHNVFVGDTSALVCVAPELAHNRAPTEAADVYSFGIVLYEMLSGKIPFSDMHPLRLVHEVVTEQKRPPLAIEPPISQAVQNLLTKCWDTDPLRRPKADEIFRFLKSGASWESLSESVKKEENSLKRGSGKKGESGKKRIEERNPKKLKS